MQCPSCQNTDSRVLESRSADAGRSVRRRRECLNCDFRFTTYERVEATPISVLKSNGNNEAFNRSNLLNGITRACEKTSLIKEKVELITNQWYQKYHWWYTKNNFLVVGGKNATDNEKLVKTYLNENDLYFHSEDPGSGSFIMFTENRVPEFSDIDETAEGVLALSNQWNSSYSSGEIFYVKGTQVSKTPPSGEYISKGSFMIYGKKEFVKVTGCTLGYGIYENKLMLAPYRIVNRVKGNCVKLKQRSGLKKMKGKLITSALKKTFNIDITDELYIFNKPCQIIC